MLLSKLRESMRRSSKEESQFNKEFDLGPVLGKGAFSTVHLAIRKSDQVKFATKVVSRRKLPPVDEAALRLEAKTLMGLNHPNIVQLMGWYEEKDVFYMPLELCEGGELFGRLVKKSIYSEMEARDLIEILLSAISYCHERGIMHRDLKPENLLLVSEYDDATIKVADFGFAKVTNIPKGFHTQCGTPGYVAPEILKRVPYGKEVDIWSVGVICYLLLGGYPPFHDSNQLRLFLKIKKGTYAFHPKYWDGISEDAKDLIRRMLVVDPSQRITAADALRHPWIRTSSEVLSSRSLLGTLENLRCFNAKRKLKALITSVVWANMLHEMIKSRDIHEHYEFKGLLGTEQGPYHSHYKGISKRPDSIGREVVIKAVTRCDIPERDLKSINMELDVLKKLRHPSIIHLYDTFQDETKFYMVLELAEGGELFDRIVKKVTYDEYEARELIRRLLRGVSYCHSRDIVHRDLKPEKILLVSADNDFAVKIAGFGFADYISPDKLLRAQCGTPGYVAPEILKRLPYGREVDMWSIGVICFVLLGGYPPFYDDDQKKLFMKIRRGEYRFHPDYWGRVSSEAKDLIRRMLTVDPSQRITAELALAHPYLKMSAEVLSCVDMTPTLVRLRAFNARRKFRSAILSIIAMLRFTAIKNSLENDSMET